MTDETADTGKPADNTETGARKPAAPSEGSPDRGGTPPRSGDGDHGPAAATQATPDHAEPGTDVDDGRTGREIIDAAANQPEIIGTRKGMFGVHGTGDTSGYGGLTRTVAMPGGTFPPYGGWFDQVHGALAEVAPEGAIEKVVVHRGEITFFIRREHLREVAQGLRDDETLRFELLSGVSGVHYPEETGRELHAVYHLLSMTHNRRIRVEVVAPDSDPHIPSLTATYPTADWHERETFDFFGIVFDGHPALTRIMMPDDWPGHPQRKDYPLGGIPVEYKGATIPPADTRRSYS